MYVQGVFFNWCPPKIHKYGKKLKYQNWCPPKNSKYQPVRKFWHLGLLWWDLLCNLTLRTFRGGPVKKNTLYIDIDIKFKGNLWKSQQNPLQRVKHCSNEFSFSGRPANPVKETTNRVWSTHSNLCRIGCCYVLGGQTTLLVTTTIFHWSLNLGHWRDLHRQK